MRLHMQQARCHSPQSHYTALPGGGFRSIPRPHIIWNALSITYSEVTGSPPSWTSWEYPHTEASRGDERTQQGASGPLDIEDPCPLSIIS